MGLKAVIVGYGGMGSWHHEALLATKELEVIGMMDVREEAQIKGKAQHLTVYQQMSEIVLDKLVDVVIIATPNDSHKRLIIEALEGGKHVVCEKPVTLSAQDLRDIMAVSATSPGLFTIHQNRRWDTDFRMVQTIFHEELIGTPYFVESRVNGSSVFLHGWRDFKVNGGGMLYDWGVHLIDQLLQLTTAKVISVTAHVKQIFSEEVDDNVKIILEFADGLSCLIEVATNCFIPFPRWHLSGKAGTAIIKNWQCEGQIIQLIEGSQATWTNEIVYTAAGPTRTMAPRPKTTTQELPLPQVEATGEAAFYSAIQFYGNLVKAINGEEELIVKAEEALRVIEVIEVAFVSARNKRGISCSI